MKTAPALISKELIQLQCEIIVYLADKHLITRSIRHTRQAHTDIPDEPDEHMVFRFARMNDTTTPSICAQALNNRLLMAFW